MSSVAAARLSPTQVISREKASEYDHILLIDQSGSMGDPSDKMKGASRWQEAREFTEGYARYAEGVDDDGLTVITFNSNATVYDGVKADAVKEIFAKNTPFGGTRLAPALEAALKKKFKAGKPAIIMVITDGAANDMDEVKATIIEATKKIERGEEIGIQFIQIGSDPAAKEFLENLDDNLKGAKFDIVNTLTREQAEGYSIEQLLYLALND